MWQPIETAPNDGTPILANCVHDADDYIIDGGKMLTPYGCACEEFEHIEDGYHVVYWEHCTTDGDWEGGYYTIPGYWAVNGTDGEICANPVVWMPIPDL